MRRESWIFRAQGLFLTVVIVGTPAGSRQTDGTDTGARYSLPGSSSECYLLHETSGSVDQRYLCLGLTWP